MWTPGSLFRSDDAGETWLEDEALNDHPTRDRWEPGAGGLILHSIVLDPVNADRMWVAISAAGVFRTEDGGRSWQPFNSGLKNILAKYEPNAELYLEVGQCVHHMVCAAGGGDRLYAQTHWGTYRSDDGAATWNEITEGLPSDFGLMIAAHPWDADVAYVLPLQGAEFRCPPEGKLRVFRTADAGRTWQPLTRGLPQRGAFMSGYREAMVCDSLEPAGVYFGTNTGQIYASADEGESWRRLTADLPPVPVPHDIPCRFEVTASAVDLQLHRGEERDKAGIAGTPHEPLRFRQLLDRRLGVARGQHHLRRCGPREKDRAPGRRLAGELQSLRSVVGGCRQIATLQQYFCKPGMWTAHQQVCLCGDFLTRQKRLFERAAAVFQPTHDQVRLPPRVRMLVRSGGFWARRASSRLFSRLGSPAFNSLTVISIPAPIM